MMVPESVVGEEVLELLQDENGKARMDRRSKVVGDAQRRNRSVFW